MERDTLVKTCKRVACNFIMISVTFLIHSQKIFKRFKLSLFDWDTERSVF